MGWRSKKDKKTNPELEEELVKLRNSNEFQRKFKEEWDRQESCDPEFPELLDVDEARDGVKSFLRSRLPYVTENEDIQFVWGHWGEQYPLPIGCLSINDWIHFDGVNFNEKERSVAPPSLVERNDAILGYAVSVSSEKAKCWILGLVERDIPVLQIADEMRKSGIEAYVRAYRAWYSPSYHFTNSILLYEGEPDLELFEKAQKENRNFNEKVLGKSFRGRPSEGSAEFLSKASRLLREDPGLPQEKLAELLSCDIKTIKRKVRKSGYSSYPDLRRHFLIYGDI